MEFRYSIINTPDQQLLHHIHHHLISPKFNSEAQYFRPKLNETVRNLHDHESGGLQSDKDLYHINNLRTVWNAMTSTLNENEFEYPIHTVLIWMNVLYFLKFAKDWKLDLESKNDLKV